MPSTISPTVMRRVRTIHLFRTYGAPALALGSFLLALWGVGRQVWVAKVFENMPSVADVPAVVGFYARAFVATDFLVQLLLLVSLAAFVWVAREAAHALSTARTRLA